MIPAKIRLIKNQIRYSASSAISFSASSQMDIDLIGFVSIQNTLCAQFYLYFLPLGLVCNTVIVSVFATSLMALRQPFFVWYLLSHHTPDDGARKRLTATFLYHINHTQLNLPKKDFFYSFFPLFLALVYF